MIEWLAHGLDEVIGRLGLPGLIVVALLVFGYIALWFLGYV